MAPNFSITPIKGSDKATRPSNEEIEEWDAMATTYAENLRLYDGTAAQELDLAKTPVGGRFPYKWPLRINPIGIACRIHQQTMVGEVKDPAEVPAPSINEPTNPGEESSVKEAETADKALRRVEYENSCATIDVESMIRTQIYGGTVQRVVFDDGNKWLPSQIRIESVLPEECWFRWSGSDYWHPTEAWLRRYVDGVTATSYGVPRPDDTIVEYLEYWSDDRREITIDGQPARNPNTKESMFGPNVDGFVPFIYIPHVRAVGAWGESFLPGSVGLFEELNARMADIGDDTYLGAHEYIWGHGITTLTERRLPDGRVWLDAGKTIGRGTPPFLGHIERGSLTEGVTRFIDVVLEMLRLQLMTSNPAYGKLEGTQRSGQTVYSLNDLMYSHVDLERMFYTQGLLARSWMILRLATNHGVLGVTEEMVQLMRRVIWQPKVAPDRAALVNELTTRIADGSASIEHAMERYGDIHNIEEEMDRVREWKKEEAEVVAASRPAPFGGEPKAKQPSTKKDTS